MNRQRSNSKPRTAWWIALTLLCVALVVVGGTIQMVHTHPQGDVSHADCAFCATAHVTVQASAVSVLIRATPVVAIVEEPRTPARSSMLSVFALFTRPPPAAPTPA